MSSQGYKRTNFEDDDYSTNGGSPPTMDFVATVGFRGSGPGLPVVWKRRTWTEKLLIVLVGVLVLVVVIMSCVLALKDNQIQRLLADKEKADPEKKLCLTPECVQIASTMLRAMDRSSDPCQDFYQYACGGWMKDNPIPAGHTRWGTFELMWQKNMLVMKNALDKPDSELTSQAKLKAKKYYKSCMDENKLIEEAGAKPLLGLLEQPGWGINLSQWDQSWRLPQDWNFNKMMEEARLLDVGVFFSLWVAEDDKNSSTNVLQISQGGLCLPERDYYLNKTISEDKVLTAYLKYMVTVFQLLGAPNETFTREHMIKVIQLETEIANITMPLEDRRDGSKLYHLYEIGNLTWSFPAINWANLANHLFSQVNISVTPTEKVVVYAPEFLEGLNIILQDYSSTDEGRKVLFSYILWQVVSEFASLLSKPFRTAKKEFDEVVSGLTGSDDLWHMCIADTDSVMGFAIGALFVKDTFVGESKTKAKTMIADVKKAFIENMASLDWMDLATKEAAIDKANAISDMIGYPEFIMNETLLDQRYQELDINETDYFGNNLASISFNLGRMLKKLREKPQTEWAMTPATVNAYYTANKNSIAFPAGILQAPFFDKSFPQSLNYGAMGVVMGHELTHGFDDQGREYDKYGNLKQWWNSEAVAKFENKTKCMIDQYSNFEIYGEHERGKQTLGENIADNGGLKSAYRAYKSWVQQNKPEPQLPALGLSHDQLFFLSFAQVWCWNSKAEKIHMQLMTDPHSPAKFRVIGPLSNSKDFSRVYDCSSTSKMNPPDKCDVW